jgi:site-specific recombinase XerD
MNALAALPPEPRRGGGTPEVTWDELYPKAPQMCATISSYLDQLMVSSRPRTVDAVEVALRLFVSRITVFDPACRAVADIERRHVEDYKSWLAARRGRGAKPLSTQTIRHRLGLLRTFFERLIEYDEPDAPSGVLVFTRDFPILDEPLPKFLDDPTAAKFMAAVAADPNRRRRLMIELLARTGMRVGELSALEDDAMVRIGEFHWLRVPVGKLHNDRYVPLHPILVDLIVDYRAERGRPRSGRLVERDDGRPFDRRTIHRYVAAVAKRAGIGHVHPHQLRHTLATQAINRGMSLEAIAAMLGHRSMDMTLTYARISNRTVADEYFKVTQAVEAGIRGSEPLAAHSGGPNMARLAADHHRHLGNGHCTRPRDLDCGIETACERCGFFETGPQFVTILRRQRDHSAARTQEARTQVFDELIRSVTEAS